MTKILEGSIFSIINVCIIDLFLEFKETIRINEYKNNK